MNTLAIDAANDSLALALQTATGRFTLTADEGLHHSERLIPFAEALLSRAGIEPGDINLVACMGGPGSFTGLRIGMSAAKGLATALSIPFIAISTLQCHASAYAFWPGLVIPIIDAKKSRFYCAIFQDGARLCSDMDATGQQIGALAAQFEDRGPVLLTGPDAEILSPAWPTALAPPRSSRRNAVDQLLELAIRRFEETGSGDSEEMGPEYLRKSEAELAMEDAKKEHGRV